MLSKNNNPESRPRFTQECCGTKVILIFQQAMVVNAIHCQPSSRVASNLSTMDTIWIPFGLQSDRLKDKALAICFLIFLNMWVFILARNSHMRHRQHRSTTQQQHEHSTARPRHFHSSLHSEPCNGGSLAHVV